MAALFPSNESRTDRNHFPHRPRGPSLHRQQPHSGHPACRRVGPRGSGTHRDHLRCHRAAPWAAVAQTARRRPRGQAGSLPCGRTDAAHDDRGRSGRRADAVCRGDGVPQGQPLLRHSRNSIGGGDHLPAQPAGARRDRWGGRGRRSRRSSGHDHSRPPRSVRSDLHARGA